MKERFVQLPRKLVGLLDQGVDHSFAIFTINLGQHYVACVTLDQRRDMRVTCARDKVTFPVTRHSAIFNRGWPLTDRYRVGDPAVIVRLLCVMARAAHRACAPEMLH